MGVLNETRGVWLLSHTPLKELLRRRLLIIVVDVLIQIPNDLRCHIHRAVQTQAQIDLHGHLVAIDELLAVHAHLFGTLDATGLHQGTNCLLYTSRCV